MTRHDTDRLPPAPDTELRLALEGPGGRRHSLPHGSATLIGSASDSDIVIGDRFASCRHARIRFVAGGYRVEDLGSTNGTRVDGIPVQRARLEAGMTLGIGRQNLRVVRIDATGPCGVARPRRAQASVEHETPHRIIGESSAICQLRRTLGRLAKLPLPVLVRGETGTGKELVARTLHEFGPFADAPFVALNCAAIPAGLFESELFGHRRGAFTGAHRDHAGAFVRAGRGTVFLDEVAELPAAAQAKLLRVLEVRRVTPVGSEQEIEVQARVVTATHRNLGEMIAGGDFREDLYHRISVLDVDISPLRERSTDIPVLIHHFAAQAAGELSREVTVSKQAVQAAIGHPWPGNVRALRNAVLRAAALADGPITAAQLLPRTERLSQRRTVAIPRGTYAQMHAALLNQIVAEEGSIRRAARVLEVPRSTLGSWLQRP